MAPNQSMCYGLGVYKELQCYRESANTPENTSNFSPIFFFDVNQ
jgi:hypothetical protein